MDRQVEAYLKDQGYVVGTGAEGDGVEAAPSYSEWYTTKVLGLDTEAYRREFWREAFATGRSIGHEPRTIETLMRNVATRHGDFWSDILLCLALLQGVVYPFWLLARLAAKQVSRLRRSTYYERERERRWRLADERIAIRVRRTANPRPSLDEVRAAWRRVHATRGREHALAVLRCGALLEDLEGYVDNHAYVTRGVPGIRGRAPGIKGLFRDQAPDLFDDYRNIMRCKALAKKYRQAVGCPDPVPTSAILPARPDFAAKPEGTVPPEEDGADPWTGGTVVAGGVAFPHLPCLEDAESLAAWMRVRGNTAYLLTREWLKTPAITYTAANLLPADARKEIGGADPVLRGGNARRGGGRGRAAHRSGLRGGGTGGARRADRGRAEGPVDAPAGARVARGMAGAGRDGGVKGGRATSLRTGREARPAADYGIIHRLHKGPAPICIARNLPSSFFLSCPVDFCRLGPPMRCGMDLRIRRRSRSHMSGGTG